jgi:L-threonylcarbamoyladenylate synthase
MKNQPHSIEQEITEILKVLKHGGIICYPTDTVWSLGCDATNSQAVEKLYKIKGCDESKSMFILVDTIDAAARYVDELPEVAVQLFELSDEPLTIILDGATRLARNLPAQDGTIGISVIDHPLCTPLLRKFNKPLVSTSANISGQPTPSVFFEIDPQILESVDYVVQNGREQMAGMASRIIKLGRGGEVKIIR